MQALSKSTFTAILVASMVLASSGCGDDTGGGGGAGGDSSGTGSDTTGSGNGVTSCGDTTCPAGQYCVNDITCNPGCTSNANCQDGSTCQDNDVTGVGTCSEVERPVEKNCEGFIQKCEACDFGDQCSQQTCDGLSTECVNCLADINCQDDVSVCPTCNL